MTKEKEFSLKPLGNRVIAQRIKPEEVTKNGLILPDSAKEKQNRAIVMAVGEGSRTKDGETILVPVKVGDVILMDRYGAQEVVVDGEDYLIVKGEDIIAVVLD